MRDTSYKYAIFIPSANLYVARNIKELTYNISEAKKFSINNPFRFMVLLKIKLLHPDAEFRKILELKTNFNIDLGKFK